MRPSGPLHAVLLDWQPNRKHQKHHPEKLVVCFFYFLSLTVSQINSLLVSFHVLPPFLLVALSHGCDRGWQGFIKTHKERKQIDLENSDTETEIIETLLLFVTLSKQTLSSDEQGEEAWDFFFTGWFTAIVHHHVSNDGNITVHEKWGN